jgi:hypothetical protein
MMLEEENLSVDTLVIHLADLKRRRDAMKEKMTSLEKKDAIGVLVREINAR